MTINTEKAIREARRFEAGKALLSNPSYEFLDHPATPGQFSILKDGEYAYGVLVSETETLCSCPEFAKTFDFCKHTFAAEAILQEEAQVARLEELHKYDEVFTDYPVFA